MTNFGISQLFALGSLIVTVLSSWGKGKKAMLAFLVADSVFLASSYMFLGEVSGAITNLLCLCRNLFAIYKDKHPKWDKPIIFVLIALAHTVGCLASYTGPVSLLPLVAAYISCYYSYSKNDTVVRVGIAMMIGTWLCYDIAIHSPVSIVSESIGFTSAVFAVIKHEILPRVKKARAAHDAPQESGVREDTVA